MQRLKFLKTYNQGREKDSKSRVFVTEHLPNELYQEKKKLLPLYKEARCNKKLATWMIKNSECCLLIEGKLAYNSVFAIAQLRDGILGPCFSVILI